MASNEASRKRSPCRVVDSKVGFTVEAANRQGAQTIVARSAREAVDLIADLLNAGFTIVRLADHEGNTVDYDHLTRECLVTWRRSRGAPPAQ